MANIKINPILGHDLDLNGLYYAQAANNTILDVGTNDFSLSAWIKFSGSGNYSIIDKGETTTATTNRYVLYWYGTTGKMTLGIADSSWLPLYSTSTNAYNDDQWHHVAIKADRDGSVYFFKDGVADGSGSIATQAGNIDGTGIFRIGYKSPSGSSNTYFPGQIRDIKIYIGGLWSDAEILYQSLHKFDYSAAAGTLTDYWRCDEGTGTTLNGLVNNLTLSNALAWSTQSKLKINRWLGHDLDLNALYYAQAANNTILDVTTEDISVSAWVKVDVDAGYSPILFKSNSDSGVVGYKFNLTSGGLLVIRIHDGVDDYYALGTTNIRDNKWHHIVGIIDRDNGANCKVYLDGIDNTASRTGTIGNIDSITNSVILALGAESDAGFKFDGQICDVKILIAAGSHWSDAEILYQSQHKFDYSAAAGTLTDAWPCDEGSGLVLNGLVNNLTLSNALAWSTQAKLAIETGLVGWWKMDEASWNGTANEVIDYSGKRSHGRSYNGAQTAVGQIGRAGSFDGTNDYVSIPVFTNYTRPLTFSFWLKAPDQSSKTIIQAATYANKFLIYSRIASPMQLSFYVSGTDEFAFSETLDNTWHYYNFIIDGVGNRFIYKDGVSQTVINLQNNISNPQTSTALKIGSGLGSINGLIDDVKIYSYARSSEQILQDYNRGLAGRE